MGQFLVYQSLYTSSLCLSQVGVSVSLSTILMILFMVVVGIYVTISVCKMFAGETFLSAFNLLWIEELFTKDR